MTTISPTSGASPSLQSLATSAASQNGKDFNMFLKLLTSQMQNQDPLDPMDTSQYTQQLVQYSQVEQSIQQTGTLKEILASLSSQNLTAAASFIGREAKFDGAIAGLDAVGGSASWSYVAARPATTLQAVITDASGKTVRQIDLDPAAPSGRVTWDGVTFAGSRAASGPYSLSIVGKDANGDAVPVTVNALGTVQSVSKENNQVMVGTGGATLPLNSLLALSDVSAR